MKEPKPRIFSDGICVYVSVSVNNSLVGKVALVVANAFILSVFVLSIKEWIPGLFICTTIFLIMLIRYTLWNFYGKENLIANTKSFSYQHDYGFFKTSYITKPVHARLILTNEEKEDGIYCTFITYRKTDNLPVEIYNMTFPVSEKDLQLINLLIEQLYINELSDGDGNSYINLN